MDFITKIIAALTAILITVSGLQSSVIGFTDGEVIYPEKQDYRFDDSKLLIGGYYGGKGLGQLAENARLDFVIDSGVTQGELDEYAEHGIGIIAGGYNMPRYYGSADASVMDAWLNIDLSTYKDHPALWGDDLIDEPSAACYAALESANASYRATFPDKMCFINLFPIYANNEQLAEEPGVSVLQKMLRPTTDQAEDSTARYKKYVSDYINTISTDYICVDIYPYFSDVDRKGNEVKSTGEWYLRNLDILAEACRETGRDLWVITQAAGETKDGKEKSGSPRYCDEVSDISQQAYVCLAFGSKAIIHGQFASKGWWAPESHMIGPDGKPTETYDSVQTVNGWLKLFADEYGKYTYTSTYMLNKNKLAGFGKGELETTVDSEKADITSKNGLVIGTFDGESGQKAYVIVNMQELNDNVTAKATFTVPAGKTATLYQKSSTFKYAGGTQKEIKLDPGEGVFITVK